MMDKREIFEEQIQPKLEEIHRICHEHDIPFLGVCHTYKDSKVEKIDSIINFKDAEDDILDIPEQILAMSFFLSEIEDMQQAPEEIKQIMVQANLLRKKIRDASKVQS